MEQKTKDIRLEIIKSRQQAYDVIATRRHSVIKVYASDLDGLDLLLIGEVTAGLPSGKEAKLGFTARMIMQTTTKGLRMKLYEVWCVSYSS
jgi:hypothetical protein